MNKRYTKTYRDIKTKKRSTSSSGSLLKSILGKPRKSKRVRSEERYADAVFFGRPNRGSRAVTLPIISKRTLLATGLATLFGAWFGIMYYLPYFDLKISRLSGLKNIKVEEVTPIINEYLNQKSYLIFKNKNFFVASDSALADKIRIHFYLEDLKITKIFPNQLAIDFQEKVSSIIYDNGNDYVILDQSGTVVKNLKSCTDECYQSLAINTASSTEPLTASSSLAITTSSTPQILPDKHRPKYDSFALEYLNTPVVYDNRHQSVTPGLQNVLPKELIQTILSIYNTAHKTERNFNILYFVYLGPGNGLQIYTDKPYTIYFNPDNDLSAQFGNINIVLRDNKPTNYVDVRYANRVFWK